MTKPSQANIFMLCFLIYSSVLLPVAIAEAHSAGIINTESANFQKYLLLFQHILMYFVPMLIYCLITKTRFSDIVPHKPLSALNVVLIFFISLFTMPLMTFVASITSFFAENETGNLVNEFMSMYSTGYMLVAVAVMPAVFEELAFRGFVMSGYKRCGMFKAVLFSAIFFGIMHLDLYQLLYAVTAGAVLGVLVYYTNSIFASMLGHFVINGSQVLMAKLFVDEAAFEMAEEVSNMDTLMAAFFLLLCSLPFFIGLMYAFVKTNSGKEVDYQYNISDKKAFETVLTDDKPKILDFAFFASIAIFILYILLSNLVNLMQ